MCSCTLPACFVYDLTRSHTVFPIFCTHEHSDTMKHHHLSHNTSLQSELAYRSIFLSVYCDIEYRDIFSRKSESFRDPSTCSTFGSSDQRTPLWLLGRAIWESLCTSRFSLISLVHWGCSDLSDRLYWMMGMLEERTEENSACFE